MSRKYYATPVMMIGAIITSFALLCISACTSDVQEVSTVSAPASLAVDAGSSTDAP